MHDMTPFRISSRILLGLLALTLGGCVAKSTPGPLTALPADLDPAAQRLLVDAAEAMGGVKAIGRIRSIYAAADCISPRGPFRTTVQSLPPDSVFFDQLSSAQEHERWIIGLDEAWAVDAQGNDLGDLAPPLDGMAHGHEFHVITLNPALRYGNAIRRTPDRFKGHFCDVLEFTDVYGKPVLFYFDAETHLPRGFTIVEPMSEDDAEIVTTFDDWRFIESVQLFHRAVITHRGEEFEYAFTDIRFNSVDESLFQRPDRK